MHHGCLLSVFYYLYHKKNVYSLLSFCVTFITEKSNTSQMNAGVQQMIAQDVGIDCKSYLLWSKSVNFNDTNLHQLSYPPPPLTTPTASRQPSFLVKHSVVYNKS